MRSRRLVGCVGLLLFGLALVGISVYALAVVRKYSPQAFANLPANPIAKKLTVSGTIYAADTLQQENGHTVAVPVAATITCNGARATSGSDGRYRLTLVVADVYLCAVSDGANGQPREEVVPGTPQSDFRLDFSLSASQDCVASHTFSGFTCPLLVPRPGGLSGTVTNDDTHKPMANTLVDCWNPSGSTAQNVDPYKSFIATTDSQGTYSFANVPVDHYVCNASGDWRLQAGGVATNTSTTLNLPLCQAHCAPVAYHTGPVMHTYTAYLVYWLPKGYTYDAKGNSSYERITSNYFNDVGGTAYYKLITQYWDTVGGPILDSVTLGGTWMDARSYPRAATRANPLTNDDITTEVSEAISANNWTVDNDHAVFVFTGYGAEICDDALYKSCSFSPNNTAFCGYHDYIPEPVGQARSIYAEIVDNESCVGSLADNPNSSPNGDRVADEVVDTLAHEQFESATDPFISAWYKDPASTGEIGDLCEHTFGYVHLAHGHTYYIQSMWSNASNGCAFHL